MNPRPTWPPADDRVPVEREGESAVETLTDAFVRPLACAHRYRAAGQMIAMVTAHQVPWELLRAAGFVPIVHRSTHDAFPLADQIVEEDALGRRAKSVIETALTGDLSVTSLVACSRSSEQDYKTYLYLRELARQGIATTPPVRLFDLLYSRTDEARQYGLDRTRQFFIDAAAVAGRTPDEARLVEAIHVSNAARAAMRRLLVLREGRPRITGTRALTLLGSSALVDRPAYTTSLNQAVEELETASPLPGPRLLLVGATTDDTRLHAFLESLGAVVVAEDGNWGTRSVGRDMPEDGDPVAAVFDKYYDDVPASRAPEVTRDVWLGSFTRTTIDAVVFYLPFEDSVAGWDVPRQRSHFESLAIPTFVIRDLVPDAGMRSRWEAPVRAFLARLGAQ